MTDAPKAKPVAPKDIKYAKAPLTAFGHYVCGEVDSMMMGSTRPASFSAHLKDAWKPDYDQLPDASKGAFDALAANAAEERRRKHEEQLARFAPGTQQQAPTGALDT